MFNNTKFKMNQIFTHKKNIFSNLNLLLILILPIGLLAGSLVNNIIVILIGILFLLEIFFKKDWNFFNEKNFYFLIIINLYLVFNSYFISENQDSIIKSFGFFRFILLAYAISYYIDEFKIKIIKFWFVIFLIVTFDLIFEYIFGKNLFGYQSNYPGRLAGFTGDELKIGGYYFGFILLSLFFLIEKKKYLICFFSLTFFIVALLIGERSNFIKIFIMYFLFIIFFLKISFLKKSMIVIILLSLSFLIIKQTPILKSKFVNHIFNKEIISFIKMNKKVELNEVIKSNQHFNHYYVAIQIFKDNPFFGSGFKSFRIDSSKAKYQKVVDGTSSHPHQFHFELLSELGLVGYILIVSNLLFIIFRQIKFREKNELKIFGILFIVASLVPILPSGSFFTSYGATIFFINYSFLIRLKNSKFINAIKS